MEVEGHPTSGAGDGIALGTLPPKPGTLQWADLVRFSKPLCQREALTGKGDNMHVCAWCPIIVAASESRGVTTRHQG